MEHARQKGHKSGWQECAECGRCTVHLLQGGSASAPAAAAAGGAALAGVKRSASQEGEGQGPQAAKWHRQRKSKQ